MPLVHGLLEAANLSQLGNLQLREVIEIHLPSTQAPLRGASGEDGRLSDLRVSRETAAKRRLAQHEAPVNGLHDAHCADPAHRQHPYAEVAGAFGLLSELSPDLLSSRLVLPQLVQLQRLANCEVLMPALRHGKKVEGRRHVFLPYQNALIIQQDKAAPLDDIWEVVDFPAKAPEVRVRRHKIANEPKHI